MKKRILFVLMFVFVLVITGCGKKNVTSSNDSSKIYLADLTYKLDIGFKDSYIEKSHEYEDGAHYFYLNEESESPYLEIPTFTTGTKEYTTNIGHDKTTIGIFSGYYYASDNYYKFVVPFVFNPNGKTINYAVRFVSRTEEGLKELVEKTSKIDYVGVIENTNQIGPNGMFKK